MLVYCMNLKKLEKYLRVNLLGPGPRFIKKKNLPRRGLTNVEKHWCRWLLMRLITLGDTQTHHSVGLLWTRDRPVVDIFI